MFRAALIIAEPNFPRGKAKRGLVLYVCALAVAVAGSLAFGAAEAHATCGDYLQSTGDAHLSMNDAAKGATSNHAPSPLPKRCDGPHCDKSPLAPMPGPAPLSDESSSREMAAISAFRANSGGTVTRQHNRETACALGGYRCRLERPPIA